MANYPYRDLGIMLDLDNWQKLNDNFKDVAADLQTQKADYDSKLTTQQSEYNGKFGEVNTRIDNIASEIEGEVYAGIVNGARLIWQEPVATFADLATTHPTPEEGWTAMARDTGIVYRFNSTAWVEIQEIDATAVNEVDSRLTSQLADIKKKHVIVNSQNLSDESARLQSFADNLADGDSLELRGVFNVSYLAFLTKKNIKIFGNATINYLVNDSSTCFDVFDIEDSEIEGITFIGLKGKVGAPTSFVENKNLLLKVGQAKNLQVRNCKFKKHLGRCLQVNSVKGVWADEGVLIENNWFEEMADVNSNEQTCVHMEPAAQYSTIQNNTFVDVKSAIHNFGANNRIDDNNVSNCTLSAVGSVVGYADLINLRQAHILVAQKTEADNQSKVQVKGNKINHMTGNAPAIMCIGNLSANENYFVVKDNEALVNDAPHEIIISSASGTRIVGNSLGRNSGVGNVSRIVLHKSELAILDENYFIGDVTGAIIAGSTFVDGDNVRRFQSIAKSFVYHTVSGHTNKRYSKENIGFAFIANGTVADWLSNLAGLTVTKTGTGSYTVNHSLGHQDYVIQALTESSNGIVQVNTRLETSFNIIVVDHTGVPLDTTVIGDVKLVGKGYHNAEMSSW